MVFSILTAFFFPEKDITYPAAVVAEGGKTFGISFQERLILLSPMNEGDFECKG